MSGAGGASTLPWRARLARRAAVSVGDTSRRFGLGSGSVIGGRVGMLIDGRLLDDLTSGRDVALVSGTNGKTTTTRLLARALEVRSAVASSSAGSNLPAGLAAALASSPPGVPAVLEVDEGYLGAMVQSTAPVAVTLLNLSRDQLDRVSEVRMTAAKWRRALEHADATVVANADDPLVTWAAASAGHTVWVAAGELWRSDAVGCPACDGTIEFAQNGADWWCTCGFRRPDPDVRLEEGDYVADGVRIPVSLALPGRFNEANAVMAAATAQVFGVAPRDALAAMEAVNDVEGRFAVVATGGVTTRLLLAKNPAGWAELLDLLDHGDEPVVVGINARVADGHDPSWLWDVPFERLAGRTVVATGERCRDLAVRLRHAEVAHVTVEDQMDALAAARAPRLEYIGNYTAFQQLRRHLGRAGASPSSAVFGRGSDVRPTYRDDLATSTTHRRSSGPSSLRVVVVHPELLGTYGDGGNGPILVHRAQWRGVRAELVLARADQPLPATADIYCIGGGEDGPQVQSARLLSSGALASAASGGAVVLAVCAGFQVAGRVFAGPDGLPHEGLGLLDVATVKGTGPRAVGELVADVVAGSDTDPAGERATLTGFENHSGVTRLGRDVVPLAMVTVGVGNGAGDGTEGARCGSVVGTYLHGPVLARNPWLADMLLALATGQTLEPLDDTEENALRAERLSVVMTPPWRRHVAPLGRRAHALVRRP